MLLFLPKIYVLAVILRPAASNFLKQAREQHTNQLSTNSDYHYLASTLDRSYINKVLDNILIPRVVGTENHEKVFAYIRNELKRHDWQVSVDQFIDKTPTFGNLTFKNIIATTNPQADRFLVLACHYDSKYFKDIVFVGAVDSAVPCAMLLEIAKSLPLKKSSDVGLKMIFFDGEEAFAEWGPNDSIYGARHLAAKLEKSRSVVRGESVNELNRIDMLVLLDLIGAGHPVFRNFFESTERWFLRLAEIERDLHREGLLKNSRHQYFSPARPYGRVDDDHLPFLARSVPVLHLISTPFPPEWHTAQDNRDIVDLDAVSDVSLIVKAFISEYLHLSLEPSEQGLADKEL